MIGLPIDTDDIATPYDVGSGADFGNNTGNARQGAKPTDNRHLTDFTGRLALKVIGGGVRLPDESTL